MAFQPLLIADSLFKLKYFRTDSILRAEDNLEHCFFFRKALKESFPEIQLHVVNDGDASLELLQRYLPNLLFLDLAMPFKNGIQCIQKIREEKVYLYMNFS